MAKKQALQTQETGKLEGVERTRAGKVFIPAVDILDAEDRLILLADMPGVDEKSIDVTLEQDLLTIQGNVNWTAPEDFSPMYAEYEIGDYRRSFTVDETIDRDRIEATYRNGVLHLILPKAEPAKPKKIQVRAA